MLENLTALDVVIGMACFLGGLAFMRVNEILSERKAERVFHEKYQDSKIKEHDLKLSHLEAKNK